MSFLVLNNFLENILPFFPIPLFPVLLPSFIALLLIFFHFNIRISIIGIYCVIFFVLIKCYIIAAILVGATLVCGVPFIRRILLSAPLLIVIKKLGVLPKISETEKIALNAGTTWIEGEFFQVRPDIEKILNEPYEGLNLEEQKFLEKEVEEVCALVNDFDVFESQDLPAEAWKYLKEKKFFGMIIPKKYGGLEFSPLAQSAVVGKLGTRSQVLSITTMVPNSLGPGELLLKYGTAKQKNYYLPRLANGTEIPCFGLTEITAGSDASAIKSTGVLFKGSDGVLKIRLNFEKRYITLGGIATIIGLAFQLKDPEGLMPKGGQTGVTCVLLKSTLEGITRGRRHMPMYVPFINSPLWGKDVEINVDEDIIGGRAGLGKGWQMLMECLSVGRGISLPAISAAAAKFTTKVTLMYSELRRQFGISISKFEAVEEVLARMVANTYALEAIRNFTASAVKNGHKPAITNAIAKYQATEQARKIVNDGMDVLGGAAICIGKNNLLAHIYMGIPVGITVEGANIMTRALLQFGQGLMRCHPFLYTEMMAIHNEDLKAFDKNLWGHIGSFFIKRMRFITLCIKSSFFNIFFLLRRPSIIEKYTLKIERISNKFSFFADLILVMYGGGFKIREKLSGRFADILSSLYIISAILRKFKSEGSLKEEEEVVEYAIHSYLELIDKSLSEIYVNLHHKKWIEKLIKCILFLGRPYPEGCILEDKLTFKTTKMALENKPFREKLLNYVFISKDKDDHLKLLESTFNESAQAKEIIKKARLVRKNYEEARSMNIITQAEYDFILNWEKDVIKVLEVDHFPLQSTAFEK